MRLIRLITLLISTTVLISCSAIKEPVYVDFKDVEVEEMNLSNVVISAKLIFNNPNKVSVEIEADDLRLFVNGKYLGNVQLEKFTVAKNADFEIPFRARFPTKQLKAIGVIDNLFSLAAGGSVPLTVKGELVFKVAKIKFKKQLNETTEFTF